MRNRIKLLALLFVLPVAMLCMGAYDDWSGRTEKAIPFSLSITNGSPPAVIVTATTGFAVCVRRIVITNTASGLGELYNGPGGGGPSVIAEYGLLANSPLKLAKDDLGQGIFTSVGKGLYLSGATGTISGVVFVEFPTVSPN